MGVSAVADGVGVVGAASVGAAGGFAGAGEVAVTVAVADGIGLAVATRMTAAALDRRAASARATTTPPRHAQATVTPTTIAIRPARRPRGGGITSSGVAWDAGGTGGAGTTGGTVTPDALVALGRSTGGGGGGTESVGIGGRIESAILASSWSSRRMLSRLDISPPSFDYLLQRTLACRAAHQRLTCICILPCTHDNGLVLRTGLHRLTRGPPE
jgi:hypothetical protein